jgi:glycosyltransferase involved in cell wall biosynthesis
MKKKILMIGTADNLGGAARVGWNLGNQLRKTGWQVRYIVGKKNSDKKYVFELKSNFVVKMIDSLFASKAVSPTRHIMSFFLSNDIDFGASSQILNHPWYKESDLVHLHNIHGNFFKLETLKAICKEKKVVWTMHDLWPMTAHCVYCYDCGDWNKGKHHKFIWGKYGNMLWDNSSYLWNKKKNVYSECDMHLVSSSEWIDGYVRESILSDKPHTVILNGVDSKVFKPLNKVSIRKELKFPKGKRIVSFIVQGGLNDPRKGGKYFIKIAKYFEKKTNIHFLCVGGGKTKITKGNVTFVPFVNSNKELVKYYNSSDLYLFTSLADNCPHTPLEAMACGLPVVAFDVGGVKEEVKHFKNGYIAKYKDVTDTIKGVKYILNLSSRDYLNMRKKNIAKVKNRFSIESMTEQYIKVYNDI